MPPEKPASAYSTPLAFAGTSTSMVTRLLFLPSFGAADSGIRVMGKSNVHSVSAEAGASSGWNIAVDHKPPPMGRFLFFVDSTMNSAFISSSFCGFDAARSIAWLQSLSMSYSSHLSVSGDHSLMPFGKPPTHGSRGPGALANQPSL